MFIKQILENTENYMGKRTCNPTTNIDHKLYWSPPCEHMPMWRAKSKCDL